MIQEISTVRFSGATLSGGEWSELYQIWRGHSPVVSAGRFHAGQLSHSSFRGR